MQTPDLIVRVNVVETQYLRHQPDTVRVNVIEMRPKPPSGQAPMAIVLGLAVALAGLCWLAWHIGRLMVN